MVAELCTPGVILDPPMFEGKGIAHHVPLILTSISVTVDPS